MHRRINAGRSLNGYSTNDDGLLTPIDSDEQDQIVFKLEKSVPLGKVNSNDDWLLRALLRFIQILIIVVNLVLITHPYYRKDYPFLSFFSCASLSISAVLIEFIGRNDGSQIIGSISNHGVMVFNIFFGVLIILLKCMFEIRLQYDFGFVVPLSLAILVFWLDGTRTKLISALKKLKQQKYHFKDV